MTQQELNAFIKYYLEADHTQRAILVNGTWGCGKSYYIQNTLIPYLNNSGEKKHKCIVVSTYGLKSINEISKAIFLEAKLAFLSKANGAVLVGKTIFRGVTSHFGINLNPDESDLEKLYTSIDLREMLIVLEDIERTQIDIVELLGYVNNLVEHDGVKVLLVANEDKFIRYKEKATEPGQNSRNNYYNAQKEEREYTEETIHYLQIKEKTVEDTIQFPADPKGAVQQIIKAYHNLVSLFDDETTANDIVKMMHFYNNHNLRTIIFATQKTSDLIELISHNNHDCSIDFYRSVFYGIIAFSFKLKSDHKIKWEGNETYSVQFGYNLYPLYRFCFDYIEEQSFRLSSVIQAQEAFKDLYLYDENRSNNDPDLLILQKFHIQKEDVLLAAIESIKDKLADPSIISVYQYGRLAYYCTYLQDVFENYDFTPLTNLLVKNLEGLNYKVDFSSLFYIQPSFLTDTAKSQYEELKSQMKESLQKQTGEFLDYNYEVEKFHNFCERIVKDDQIGRFSENGEFFSRINIDKLITVIKQCTAEQIDEFRRSIIEVYRSINIGDFFAADKDSIIQMIAKLNEIKEYEKFDAIQRLQIRLLIFNLNDALMKLG